MTPCVIFDVDGTLADCEHRRHFLLQQPKDWDSFRDPELVMKDPPIEPVKILAHIVQAHFPIVVCTGRNESDRPVTMRWLHLHNVVPRAVYMRSDGDFRPDHVVKMELLAAIRADGYEPFLVVDDRSSVVKAWREAGLVCLQAAEGDF